MQPSNHKSTRVEQFDDETIQSVFGFEDAESEPIERLREYYLKNRAFQSVTAELPLRVLVGHKGTGKSALFKVAFAEEIERGNLAIWIRPDDIAELGKSDENFLLRIKQWKHGLNRIIGSKVLDLVGLHDGDTESNLNKFVKLTKFIYDTFTAAKNAVDLTGTQAHAVDQYLTNRKIVVFIDDLDRGWAGAKDDISRISALLNAVRDLANDNEGLRFKIALRSDVFFLVRTSDESTDKIEGAVVWYGWSNHEIFVMLVKRLLTHFGGETFSDEGLFRTPQAHLNRFLGFVMNERFHGKGKWGDVAMYRVLMTLTRKRPRDLVKLCSLAAKAAFVDGSNIIQSKHLEGVIEQYSQNRLQDTINEYRTELPAIERLIYGMKPSKKQWDAHDPFAYTTAELKAKINNIREQGAFRFTTGASCDAQDLAHFLYKINFLTARKVDGDGLIERKYFEENRYLSNRFVDFGYEWEVHPVYRWSLQPSSLEEIYRKLTPSSL